MRAFSGRFGGNAGELRLIVCFSTASIFIVNVDNVGSNQMHQIRQALRGKGEILMGKNTMVRRAVRMILPDFPQFEKFLPHVKGNVGFVFTSGDLKDIRGIILDNKVAAPAKAGAHAQVDVYVPAGNTGMEPGKTSFFQALNIPTKIARGTIEIVSDIHLVVAGTRVGSSEATLLQLLGIQPFSYGLVVVKIYVSLHSLPLVANVCSFSIFMIRMPESSSIPTSSTLRSPSSWVNSCPRSLPSPPSPSR